ncbi:MAG TPA: 3-dehydroquinate synthase [Candidatus Acidoferrales bacterium]|nr:3-dehydroquinate synthase [Candidatus Acidoferrales bacterium]
MHCARGALAMARSLIARLGDSTGAFVLSSPRVWRFCGRDVARALGIAPRRAILFDDREAAKRLATVEEIASKLVRAGADRHCLVVAVGGGVVGDVAGFAAASYLRGVRVVHIPTTLVAQVDSAIGGKTGVDLPEGKNLVGAFHPPKLVIADPDMLRTLPHREYRSGLYEVLKYGVIADAALFRFLESHMNAVLRRDADALDWIIPRCIRIKARVVNKDEREQGLRKILNFGHTLGHALEAATGYRRFLHGEAVAWGMIAATLLGVATNRTPEADASRIIRLITSVGPLPPLAGIRKSQLRGIVAGDKKSRGGKVHWVLARGIGKTEWDRGVPWPVVARAFAELPEIAAKAASAKT